MIAFPNIGDYHDQKVVEAFVIGSFPYADMVKAFDKK